jgi:hypothetical protein
VWAGAVFHRMTTRPGISSLVFGLVRPTLGRALASPVALNSKIAPWYWSLSAILDLFLAIVFDF